MAIRSIPPRTVMRDTYRSNGGAPRKTRKERGFSGHVYRPSPKIKGKATPLQPNLLREIELEIFEESGALIRIIGEFPGIDENKLIIEIANGRLQIVSGPGAGRSYQAACRLPDCFDVTINHKEMRNGVMTLVLDKRAYEEVPELEKIFQQCLKKFPELAPQKIDLKVVKSRRNGRPDSLDAAKVKANGRDAVLIFVPQALWGQWGAFKPIIYHELSHYVDLENPDRIFYKRADKKSIDLWKKLQDAGVLECKVDKES